MTDTDAFTAFILRNHQVETKLDTDKSDNRFEEFLKRSLAKREAAIERAQTDPNWLDQQSPECQLFVSQASAYGY